MRVGQGSAFRHVRHIIDHHLSRTALRVPEKQRFAPGMRVALHPAVKWTLLALACMVSVPASAATREDLARACEAVGRSGAIFIGQPQPPVSIHLSFADRVEPAGEKW